MIILAGADIVLADRVVPGGSVVIEEGRVTDITPGRLPPDSSALHFDLHGHHIVPGFIDVHVHGVEGDDTLDAPSSVARIAGHLPRYGVTAFCPTTVACEPGALRMVLDAVRAARMAPGAGAARVLPAHLESNFLSEEFAGAQPRACLRRPPALSAAGRHREDDSRSGAGGSDTFAAIDILEEIARAQPDVGIVTIAPELDGMSALIADLIRAGHRVALGHSGATFDIGLAAVAAGARHATHLFNRMPPLHHREPGLAGAVLFSEEVAAEVICDGYHVHPAMIRMAIAAKHPSRAMAITDGTAGAGLPPGARARLGGRTIIVGPAAAHLEDGTLAGSTCTMDRVFRVLVRDAGLSFADAAVVCATTPARELGLHGHGVIAPGAVADLVVLGPELEVRQTWIGGALAYSAT